jgi:hypothetical protein
MVGFGGLLPGQLSVLLDRFWARVHALFWGDILCEKELESGGENILCLMQLISVRFDLLLIIDWYECFVKALLSLKHPSAVSDNGFKLMCLLYLTPVLPLSIVSYLLGTTSMQLYKFAAAKIAAVPLMLMYVFIGASTDTLLSGEVDGESVNEAAASPKKISVDDETHRKMVLLGICLSVVSMSLVSHFVKKELNKVRIHGIFL